MVTADIPLAARCLANSVGPNGRDDTAAGTTMTGPATTRASDAIAEAALSVMAKE